MTLFETEYEGLLRCKTSQSSSQKILVTDAPKDHQGLGENLSPTDLVAVALGSCLLTAMGIQARMLNIDLAGSTANVEKTLTAVPCRRIQALAVQIRVPHRIPLYQRTKLEAAAYTCPVYGSLHPEIKKSIEFIWE